MQLEEEQWELQQQPTWKQRGPKVKTKKPMDKPIPAPAIVPLRWVHPTERPRFAPLNAGKSGEGGGKWGHPTPLTHPASSGDPTAGFMHPINDPRLASFFASHAKKTGTGNVQGVETTETADPSAKGRTEETKTARHDGSKRE